MSTDENERTGNGGVRHRRGLGSRVYHAESAPVVGVEDVLAWFSCIDSDVFVILADLWCTFPVAPTTTFEKGTLYAAPHDTALEQVTRRVRRKPKLSTLMVD